LTDEQSLIPRSKQAFVDKSRHDGFSAIPPFTTLHSERRIVTTKYAVISPKCHFPLAAFGAKRPFVRKQHFVTAVS
jgi:hypothetical protein